MQPDTATAIKKQPVPSAPEVDKKPVVLNVSLPRRVEHTMSNECLSAAVDQCLRRYFESLGGMTPPPNLHETIISQVEKPLVEHVLRYVHGNQLRASELLGINRNTLRKKIANLGIDVSQVSGRRK